MNTVPSPLIQVRDLHVQYAVSSHSFKARTRVLKAIRGVTFEIFPGEAVGLVGESGCGKSTIGRAILRLLQIASGEIIFNGQVITTLAGARLRELRRQFQIVFQDPQGALDPRLTAGESIAEAIDVHHLASGSRQRAEQVARLLTSVGLDGSMAARYPHEFSGGQRQRIGIARALAVQPRLLVCDEPVSALDVSVQAQVVNLLKDIQEEHGLAYLFIAHDLALVDHVCQRVLVMYLGQIVESGTANTICHAPSHPYTRALLAAVPTLAPSAPEATARTRGELPSPFGPPPGCPFHPRCPVAEPRCQTTAPALRQISPGHWVSCHLA